jgi:hypothetical protein
MNFENSQGLGFSQFASFALVCGKVRHQMRSDRNIHLRKAKLELARRALTQLTDQAYARAMNVPCIADFKPVNKGKLNNGERADFVVQFAGIDRKMILHVETGFPTRPGRRLRHDLARKRRHGRSLEPILFIYDSPDTERLSAVVSSLARQVKCWVSSFDRKWMLRIRKSERREEGVVIHRNHRRWPCMRTAARMAA